METKSISSKVIGGIAVAFLIFAIVQIWWQSTEKEEQIEEGQAVVARSDVEGERTLEITGSDATDEDAARRREVERLVKVLEDSADIQKRRSAALRLYYFADAQIEDVLLECIADEDRTVAQRCEKSLSKIWQSSTSPSASRFLEQALSAMHIGNYDKALSRLELCEKLDPDIPDLYRLKALIQRNLGKIQEARKAAQEAIRLKPMNFHAHYQLALCHVESGSPDEAIPHLEKALRLYPWFDEAKKLLDDIKNGNND
jgi:tetratricopeptide (TPR) repeat protein